MGRGMWMGGLERAHCPSPHFFHFCGHKMRILVHSPAYLSTVIRPGPDSRPPVRLPTLTFQVDCGSIKGAGGH